MKFENETIEKITIDYIGRKIKLYGSDGSFEVIEDNNVGQFMSMLSYIKNNAPENLIEHSSIN